MKSELPPVLVAYNLPRVREGTAEGIGAWTESEAGVLEEVSAVTEALERLGVRHRSVGIHGLDDLRAVLATAGEPVMFNLIEDLEGSQGDASLAPSLCRSFGKACTGGDSRCLGLSSDKWLSKASLASFGVPCPQGVLVGPGSPIPGQLPPAPLIVKPVSRDGSEGIEPASVVESTGADLRKAVEQVHHQFNQPALVEQFIEGREINASLLQRGGQVQVLPLAEIDFSAFPPHRPHIVDYRAKWAAGSFEYRNTPRLIPAGLNERQAKRIRRTALDAWGAVGCTDYARVDFRLDGSGNAFVLEVNANPDISPNAGFAAALRAAGIKYEDFVRTVISNAASRLEAIPAAHAGTPGGA
jgi:D-alanine-D-alanine ligase